eukprot:TRINITY_DN32255_c0_g1_i1.p1 TRINITY_DN32255_c0_g1~~TRINITY_DN32255_c0_g1_i1.p1  ORF type:complete len:450 (+),score=210.90 TRINITY_DN32255_c0_g1_i1:63-1412(+)
MGKGLTRSRSKTRLTATEKRCDLHKRSLSKLHAKLNSSNPDFEESEDEYEDLPFELEAESIDNQEVMAKYKLGARFVQQALEKVIAQCVVGMDIAELCAIGDKHIEEQCDKEFRKGGADGEKVFKGLAFPTSVSCNDLTAHYAPHAKETTGKTLKDGDVAKIHMAAHIDGYVSQVAHTIFVGDHDKLHEKAGDVTNAAYTAAELAMRMMRPDLQNANEAVTNMYSRVAKDYDVTVSEAVLSHRVLRWNQIGPACVLSVRISNIDDKFQEVEDYVFGMNEVWHLDVVMSSGHAGLHCAEEPTTIYKRNDILMAPKMRASHYVLKAVREKHLMFPFNMGTFENVPMGKLGVSELKKMDLVDPIPVLKTKKQDVTARFSWTLMLTEHGVVRLTGLPLPQEVLAATEKALVDPACEAISKASTMAPSHPTRKARAKKAAKRQKKDTQEVEMAD